MMHFLVHAGYRVRTLEDASLPDYEDMRIYTHRVKTDD